MLTVEEVSKRLRDRTLTKVALASGLSYPSVFKVARWDGTERVDYETVKKLSDYLEATG
jgi:hypothetical protein